MSGNVHVSPGADGWSVRVEGNPQATSFRTQGEAIAAGRRLAQGNRSEEIIHDVDGRIRQRDSYGRDPFPRRR